MTFLTASGQMFFKAAYSMLLSFIEQKKHANLKETL